MTRPQWIQQLEREVIERDDSTCINCGRPAADVHHIVPRNRKPKHSPEVWREENMMCICDVCHRFGQTVWMRKRLIRMMQELGYDMDWAKDEVVMEEGNNDRRKAAD